MLSNDKDEMIAYTTKNNKNAVIMVGIIKDGKMSYTVFDNNASTLSEKEHIYEIGSLTKTFTSSLLCKAISEGKIDLNLQINKYIDLPEKQYYPTLKRLVTHTTGYKGLNGKKFYTMLGFVSMYFSGGVIPFFLLISWLNMYDSFWIYIIPSLFGGFYNVIIFNTNFKVLPISLFESAKIDGAREFTIYLRNVMPLSKPVLQHCAYSLQLAYGMITPQRFTTRKVRICRPYNTTF